MLGGFPGVGRSGGRPGVREHRRSRSAASSRTSTRSPRAAARRSCRRAGASRSRARTPTATYTAGTGSGTAGDTYSFGAAGSAERAFGTLLSGSLTLHARGLLQQRHGRPDQPDQRGLHRRAVASGDGRAQRPARLPVEPGRGEPDDRNLDGRRRPRLPEPHHDAAPRAPSTATPRPTARRARRRSRSRSRRVPSSGSASRTSTPRGPTTASPSTTSP